MNDGDDDHGLTDSDLTADLDLGFEGADDILRAWRRGVRPYPDLTVSEWADAHRWLSSRAFNTPLLVEPAKAVVFLSGLGPRILER
ncbi:hypothetical protein ACROSR_12425 [Roseovarius tibetensis]|uniref:hypothetical protein n=1 Tax=Roseovarius tibetensis TaxID=2685897 RepID=UPI003D7FEC3A